MKNVAVNALFLQLIFAGVNTGEALRGTHSYYGGG